MPQVQSLRDPLDGCADAHAENAGYFTGHELSNVRRAVCATRHPALGTLHQHALVNTTVVAQRRDRDQCCHLASADLGLGMIQSRRRIGCRLQDHLSHDQTLPASSDIFRTESRIMPHEMVTIRSRTCGGVRCQLRWAAIQAVVTAAMPAPAASANQAGPTRVSTAMTYGDRNPM